MGGERMRCKILALMKFGSSPRERGTRMDIEGTEAGARFIPAWAGNAVAAGGRAVSLAVHPRVGGERCVTDQPTPERNG